MAACFSCSAWGKVGERIMNMEVSQRTSESCGRKMVKEKGEEKEKERGRSEGGREMRRKRKGGTKK